MERTGVAAMALGISEQCRELCVDYARTRVQFGRPIGEFQLIQSKLAKIDDHRAGKLEFLPLSALDRPKG